MTRPTSVYVYGNDPITQAGVLAQLRTLPQLRVVDETEVDESDVAVVIADEIDERTLPVIRALQRNGCPRVVLVVADVEEADVAVAVEAGVACLLRRSAATRDSLLAAITAAATGEGYLPPDLLGGLLRQVRTISHGVLAPRGFSFTGLSTRELEVLRLVSEGSDTREIAKQLSYSERTVKNVLQDITRRFGLRNRSHAVAYAMRQGLL
jgi:DNA-binding NarL/FixJ family response regulator